MDLSPGTVTVPVNGPDPEKDRGVGADEWLMGERL
jgi:hypothetical protein